MLTKRNSGNVAMILEGCARPFRRVLGGWRRYPVTSGMHVYPARGHIAAALPKPPKKGGVMGGMIRMQLLTDFCMRLERKGIIDGNTYRDVHLAGNMTINGGEDWPFEKVISNLVEGGIDEKLARRELYAATANSTAISYLQLGRPETIIVHPDEKFAEEAQQNINH